MSRRIVLIVAVLTFLASSAVAQSTPRAASRAAKPRAASTADDQAPPDEYRKFGNFAYAVANRYRGRIPAYQVWNEPNVASGWGNRPVNPADSNCGRMFERALRSARV